MKKSLLLLSLLLLAIQVFAQESYSESNDAYLKYIDKYKVIAIKEMERAGIPASIKLAQGLLESNAGRSTLARKANNHFGIKCGDNWKGKKIYREDDDYNEDGKLIKSCFRKYKNVEASYIAHSEFLRDPKKRYRYGRLFRLDIHDYKGWAKGLKDSGYATSGTYTEKLIDIIERYELYKYDDMTPFDNDNPVVDLNEIDIFRNNSVRYAKANANETLADIAKRTDTTIRRLMQYNDGIISENKALEEGQIVYLQPKRNAYRGKEKYHYVTKGQTMLDISQLYGVKLSKLLKRNRLEAGMIPAPGEKIKLRGCSKVKVRPKLIEEVDPSELEPIIPELEMESDTTEVPKTDADNHPTLDTTPVSNKIEEEADGNFMDDSEDDDEELPFIVPDADFDDEPEVEEVPRPEVTEEEALPTPPVTTTPVSTEQYHTVIKGDTLWGLAKKYNTTVDEIKKLNKLKSNELTIGMKLKVKE